MFNLFHYPHNLVSYHTHSFFFCLIHPCNPIRTSIHIFDIIRLLQHDRYYKEFTQIYRRTDMCKSCLLAVHSVFFFFFFLFFFSLSFIYFIFVYLFIHLFIYLSILSIDLFIIYLLISFFTFILFIYLFIYLFYYYFFIFISLIYLFFIYLFDLFILFLSIYLFIYLFIFIFFWGGVILVPYALSAMVVIVNHRWT